MMSAATPLRPTRASEDLPRERLARCGASALRDDELLAIVLGTDVRGTTVMDVATSILHRHPAEALVSLELEALQDVACVRGWVCYLASEGPQMPCPC